MTEKTFITVSPATVIMRFPYTCTLVKTAWRNTKMRWRKPSRKTVSSIHLPNLNISSFILPPRNPENSSVSTSEENFVWIFSQHGTRVSLHHRQYDFATPSINNYTADKYKIQSSFICKKHPCLSQSNLLE